MKAPVIQVYVNQVKTNVHHMPISLLLKRLWTVSVQNMTQMSHKRANKKSLSCMWFGTGVKTCKWKIRCLSVHKTGRRLTASKKPWKWRWALRRTHVYVRKDSRCQLGHAYCNTHFAFAALPVTVSGHWGLLLSLWCKTRSTNWWSFGYKTTKRQRPVSLNCCQFGLRGYSKRRSHFNSGIIANRNGKPWQYPRT